MSFRALIQDEALNKWSTIGPLLQKAVKVSVPLVSLSDIKEAVVDGRAEVVVSDDWKIAGLLELRVFPRGKELIFSFLGGSNLSDHLDSIIETADERARFWGASVISVTGRRGWEKTLQPAGYSLSHVTMSKRVE